MKIAHSIGGFTCSILAVVVLALTAPSSQAQDLEEVIEWGDAIELEEPEGVFTVAPHITVTEDGGFLVVDSRESQIRRYHRDGTLQSWSGSRGQGPGQYVFPFSGAQMDDGSVAVVELMGDVSLLTPELTFTARHTRKVANGTKVHNVGGSRVLIAGRSDGEPGAQPILHLYDVSRETVEKSFFMPPVDVDAYHGVLYSIGLNLGMSIRGDRVAAVYGPIAVLEIYTLEGERTHRFDLELSTFQEIEKPDRPLGPNESVRAIGNADWFDNVFWVQDDLILMQSCSIIDRRTREAVYSLVGVRMDGTVAFEIRDTPKLHAVNTTTGELFFSDPDYETENYLRAARLK